MVTLGVIGAGYWGPNHIRAFHQHPRVNLDVICDLDSDRLNAQKKLYPYIKTTQNLESVLEDNQIDAVVIALPVALHYEMAKKALMAGKHVLVEKPLTLNATQAQELIALAKQQQRILMVGHIFEYNDVVLKIKTLIDSGELGDLFYIFCQRLNLGKLRNDVDALWNLAPHDISIINYWMGKREPLFVSARGFHHLKTPLCDTGYITLEYANNMVAHILCSWLNPEKVRKITIAGSKKMVVYDDVSIDKRLQIFDKGLSGWDEHHDYGEFQLKVRSGDLLIPKIDMAEPLAKQADNFITSILNHSQPVADGLSGLRVVKILEAASQSMQQGGIKVRIQEEQPAYV